MKKVIFRRHYLRGLGALLALPALEIMSPRRALTGAAPDFPMRMGFFYVPDGVNVEKWFIARKGAQFTLSRPWSRSRTSGAI